jgi:hypothetical protein
MSTNPRATLTRITSSPLRRIELEVDELGRRSLLYQLFPHRELTWKNEHEAEFRKHFEDLAGLRCPTLARLVPLPTRATTPWVVRVPEASGVLLTDLLQEHSRLTEVLIKRIWRGVARATTTLHQAGHTLDYTDSRHILLTSEGGVLLLEAGFVPFYRRMLGKELGMATAEWLQLFPEPRLQYARLLEGSPSSADNDRQFLQSLLSHLFRPRTPMPKGGTFELYNRIRRGTWPPHTALEPESGRIHAALGEDSKPLSELAEGVDVPECEASEEMTQRARPLADQLGAAAVASPIGDVDVEQLDVTHFLGPRTARKDERPAGWRNMVMLVMLLLALAAVGLMLWSSKLRDEARYEQSPVGGEVAPSPPEPTPLGRP